MAARPRFLLAEGRHALVTIDSSGSSAGASDREITDAVEAERLREVARYRILDTQRNRGFDRIARMAARLLDAPIATVSIVDADRVWFTAAHGFDGLDQIARDVSLCALAIQRDTPYVVTDASADPRTASNPLVRGEPGIRFYAAAPIRTDNGYRLGTVDVWDTRPRECDAADLATLQDLAAVVMDELELRRSALSTYHHERELRKQVEGFASTLQSTLLPPSLPTVPGFDLACHFHTASPNRVSGDFYDVFWLGDQRWAFFLGDVTGHGAAAAAVTSLTRYTLRAAALHNSDPAAILDELNSALLMDPHTRRHCTVLFGILRTLPAGGAEMILGGGGHPPALLLCPKTRTVEEVPLPGGMLVGALPDAEFTTRRLRLEPGQTLLLYSDGLTEARPGGEFFGEHGLISFLGDYVGVSATEVVDGLRHRIGTFDPPPGDDIALLALGAREPT